MGLAYMGHRYENKRWVQQLSSELCNDRYVLDWDDFLSIVTAYEEKYYDDFQLRFQVTHVNWKSHPKESLNSYV
eukprot:6382205-Amphidinium_carterae.1